MKNSNTTILLIMLSSCGYAYAANVLTLEPINSQNNTWQKPITAITLLSEVGGSPGQYLYTDGYGVRDNNNNLLYEGALNPTTPIVKGQPQPDGYGKGNTITDIKALSPNYIIFQTEKNIMYANTSYNNSLQNRAVQVLPATFSNGYSSTFNPVTTGYNYQTCLSPMGKSLVRGENGQIYYYQNIRSYISTTSTMGWYNGVFSLSACPSSEAPNPLTFVSNVGENPPDNFVITVGAGSYKYRSGAIAGLFSSKSASLLDNAQYNFSGTNTPEFLGIDSTNGNGNLYVVDAKNNIWMLPGSNGGENYNILYNPGNLITAFTVYRSNTIENEPLLFFATTNNDDAGFSVMQNQKVNFGITPYFFPLSNGSYYPQKDEYITAIDTSYKSDVDGNIIVVVGTNKGNLLEYKFNVSTNNSNGEPIVYRTKGGVNKKGVKVGVEIYSIAVDSDKSFYAGDAAGNLYHGGIN